MELGCRESEGKADPDEVRAVLASVLDASLPLVAPAVRDGLVDAEQVFVISELVGALRGQGGDRQLLEDVEDELLAAALAEPGADLAPVATDLWAELAIDPGAGVPWPPDGGQADAPEARWPATVGRADTPEGPGLAGAPASGAPDPGAGAPGVSWPDGALPGRAGTPTCELTVSPTAPGPGESLWPRASAPVHRRRTTAGFRVTTAGWTDPRDLQDAERERSHRRRVSSARPGRRRGAIRRDPARAPPVHGARSCAARCPSPVAR